MQALKNERQRKFVYAFTILGLSQEGAAKWAGYSEVSAGDHAYRIAAHPLMQAAIEELARVLVKTRLPKAVRVLDSILENDRADESVRAKIAFGILDRAGLSTETKHTVTVDHKAMSAKELQSEFERLADKFNLSPAVRRELLHPVIDAEFHPVATQENPPFVAPVEPDTQPVITGREGLDDCL